MRRIVALVLVLTLMLGAVLTAKAADRETVQKVQEALNGEGYRCGTADGILGKRTASAIRAYQKDHGMTQNGEISQELLIALGLAEEDEKNAAVSEAEEASGEETEPTSGQSDGDSVEPDLSVEFGGETTGDPDEPALVNPEERYQVYFVEETDGSEELIYYTIDMMNDEESDVEEYGAVYINHRFYNANGKEAGNATIILRDSPYGRVIETRTKMLWTESFLYVVPDYSFYYDGGNSVEVADGDYKEDFDWYFESFHFPYGRLQTLNGVRKDENGYSYFFIKSEENMSYEFVLDGSMRIVQLRVYERNDEGHLALSLICDYDVGPVGEIPQPVLDTMEETLGSAK